MALCAAWYLGLYKVLRSQQRQQSCDHVLIRVEPLLAAPFPSQTSTATTRPSHSIFCLDICSQLLTDLSFHPCPLSIHLPPQYPERSFQSSNLITSLLYQNPSLSTHFSSLKSTINSTAYKALHDLAPAYLFKVLQRAKLSPHSAHLPPTWLTTWCLGLSSNVQHFLREAFLDLLI